MGDDVDLPCAPLYPGKLGRKIPLKLWQLQDESKWDVQGKVVRVQVGG